MHTTTHTHAELLLCSICFYNRDTHPPNKRYSQKMTCPHSLLHAWSCLPRLTVKSGGNCCWCSLPVIVFRVKAACHVHNDESGCQILCVAVFLHSRISFSFGYYIYIYRYLVTTFFFSLTFPQC